MPVWGPIFKLARAYWKGTPPVPGGGLSMLEQIMNEINAMRADIAGHYGDGEQYQWVSYALPSLGNAGVARRARSSRTRSAPVFALPVFGRPRLPVTVIGLGVTVIRGFIVTGFVTAWSLAPAITRATCTLISPFHGLYAFILQLCILPTRARFAPHTIHFPMS